MGVSKLEIFQAGMFGLIGGYSNPILPANLSLQAVSKMFKVTPFYSQDAQGNPNTLLPAQGQQFAKLSIGSYGDAEFDSLPGQYYVTSLRQEIYLQ